MAAIPGSPCAFCEEGTLVTYCTRVRRDVNARVRYLRCNICQVTPEDNKQIVSLSQSPVRKGPRKASTPKSTELCTNNSTQPIGDSE